jgi:thiol:disulfide interchange protein DsbA
MKRREFSAALLGAGAAVIDTAARAQGGPTEGTHYVQLAQPVPTSAGPGKIEVLEFFWYGCPHCFAFEPALETWVRQLPADMVFNRVPVAFSSAPFVAHQRIFYALESLGLVDAMHRKVFAGIHNERRRLAEPAEIADFMTKNGVDATAFMAAYQSFSTQAKVTRANQLLRAYQIDAVPALGINGRYMTSGTLAGSNDRMLAVADWLAQRTRKPG